MANKRSRLILECLAVLWILTVLFVYWLLSGIPAETHRGLSQLRSPIVQFLSTKPAS